MESTSNFVYRSICYLLFISSFILILILPSANMPELYESTQSGKFIIFVPFCILILLLYLVKSILHLPLFTVRFSDALIIFLLVYIVLARSINSQANIFSFRYYEMFGLSILYMVFRVLSERYMTYLIVAVGLSGIIQSVYGMLQLIGVYDSNNHQFNITGSFFNPGPYGGYLLSSLPSILGVFLFRTNLIPLLEQFGPINIFLRNNLIAYFKSAIKIGLLSGVILLLLAMGATMSRATWLGLSLTVVILSWHKFQFQSLITTYLSTNKKKVMMTSLILAFLLVLGVVLYLAKKDSADGRVLIWKTSLSMISDLPFTGVGFDNFKSNYMTYQQRYIREHKGLANEDKADNVIYAFNEPLQFTVENGIFASIVLAILIINSLMVNDGKVSYVILICKTTVISVFLFSLFSYPQQILPINLNLTLFFGYLARVDKPILTLDISKKYLNFSKGVICFILACVLLFTPVLYTRLKKLFFAFKDWKLAMEAYEQGDYKGSINYYEKATPILVQNGLFMTHFGKALEMNRQFNDALFILTRAEKLQDGTIVQITKGCCYQQIGSNDKAEEAFLNAHYMSPSKLYPQYLLVKLYLKGGQEKKAVALAHVIVKRKTKVESSAVDNIILEMQNIIDQSSFYNR